MCVSVAKQYSLVLCKRLWYSAAGKVTASLVKSISCVYHLSQLHDECLVLESAQVPVLISNGKEIHHTGWHIISTVAIKDLWLEDKDLRSEDKDKKVSIGPQGQVLVNWSSKTRTFLEDNNTEFSMIGFIFSKQAILHHNLMFGGSNRIYRRHMIIPFALDQN